MPTESSQGGFGHENKESPSPTRRPLKKIRFEVEPNETSNKDLKELEDEFNNIDSPGKTDTFLIARDSVSESYNKELIAFLRRPEIRESLMGKIILDFLDNPMTLRGDSTMKMLSKKIVENEADVAVPLTLVAKFNSTPSKQGKTPGPMEALAHFKFHKLNHTKSEKKDTKPIGGMRRHVNGYLPIAVYLAERLGLQEDRERLMRSYRQYYSEDIENKFINDQCPSSSVDFVTHLLGQLLIYNETKVYYVLLSNHSDLSNLIDEEIFEIYNENNRLDLMHNFFEALSQQINSNSSESLQIRNKLSAEAKVASKIGPQSVSDSKLILLAKYYFESSQDDHLLMKIFEKLKISKREIVLIVLDTNQEARILMFFHEYDTFLDHLTADDVIKRRVFPILALFDKKYLIDVFNLPVEGKTTVFAAICQQIEIGSDDIETLCNVVISVNETFWDLPKFIKIFKSFESLVRRKPSEDESNWLTYIENPLLFYITWMYFFNQMKKQLDFNIPEVSEVTKDMLNFCISYISNISDENLKMNLFEKDSNGREFIEYVMFVEEMKILEIEQIENLLELMWDLNRSSMQTLDTFMRVDSMMEKVKKVSFGMYTLDYETPIEDGDEFNMEFRFVSNSVKMRVLPEFGWPLTLILVDFYFSMILCQMRVYNTWDSNWLAYVYNHNPALLVLWAYVRFSDIISIGMKILALKTNNRGGEELLFIFNVTLLLYFLQMVIYPLFLWDYFWVLNNLQMLIVVANVGYITYSALSLSEVGVIIRIFFRMALVVLVFGVCSWVVMLFIAYPIHVVYMDFDQPIEGQWYPNLNLFNDLYQGVLTLFEFVFGAVVLVRLYIEQTGYTYSLTFIMIMFSFFGNIMIANMLVAFLTSQFEFISVKAKFLTMQTQYELIQVYNMKDMDAIFSLPYFLSPLAVIPFGLMAASKGIMRKRINIFLRKTNHVFNSYLPMLLIMNLKEIGMACIRYAEMALRIVSQFIKNPLMLLVHLLVWVVAGPFLLLKLIFLDNYTIAKVMLQFSKEGGDLLNFELDDDARSNLVAIFSKMSRIANRDKSREYLDIKTFLDEMGVIAFVDALGDRANDIDDHTTDPKMLIAKTLFAGLAPQHASTSQDKDTPAEDGNENEDDAPTSNAFNKKYKQSESDLAPEILKKYTVKHPQTGKLVVDLNFMRDKFKTITQQNVPYLISFDKKSLMAASIHMLEEVETDLNRQIIHVSKEINRHNDRIGHILQDLRVVQNKFSS